MHQPCPTWFALVLATFVLPSTAAALPLDLRANPDRMQQRIEALSAFGANAEGAKRVK